MNDALVGVAVGAALSFLSSVGTWWFTYRKDRQDAHRKEVSAAVRAVFECLPTYKDDDQAEFVKLNNAMFALELLCAPTTIALAKAMFDDVALRRDAIDQFLTHAKQELGISHEPSRSVRRLGRAKAAIPPATPAPRT